MHLMIDLETLGTDPRSVILSLGAVLYADDDITRTFYVELDAQEQLDHYRRHANMSTVAWWVDQDHRAKAVLRPRAPESLVSAMTGLENMLTRNEWAEVLVWSNGASFDIPILQTAFQDTGIKCPWQYYNERCFRTMKTLFKNIKAPTMDGLTKDSVKHNALNDALNQTLHLRKLLECAAAIQ